MHAVALKSLIQPGEYETETREWLKLPDDQQNWTAWKTTFRGAYVAKRRAEAAMEREDKTFGGSAVNDAYRQLWRRGHTDSSGQSPLPNHMLDSLK